MNTKGNKPTDRQRDGSSDRRWVIVSEDGRYSTFGRASDPTEDEIHRAEEGQRAPGPGRALAGWLGVMSGSAHGRAVPSLVAFRPLASPTKSWEEVSAACKAAIVARRKEAGG